MTSGMGCTSARKRRSVTPASSSAIVPARPRPVHAALPTTLTSPLPTSRFVCHVCGRTVGALQGAVWGTASAVEGPCGVLAVEGPCGVLAVEGPCGALAVEGPCGVLAAPDTWWWQVSRRTSSSRCPAALLRLPLQVVFGVVLQSRKCASTRVTETRPSASAPLRTPPGHLHGTVTITIRRRRQ